jgi:hypothetical protein
LFIPTPNTRDKNKLINIQFPNSVINLQERRQDLDGKCCGSDDVLAEDCALELIVEMLKILKPHDATGFTLKMVEQSGK